MKIVTAREARNFCLPSTLPRSLVRRHVVVPSGAAAGSTASMSAIT